MIDDTISPDMARQLYNQLGSSLDRATRFEAIAKSCALNLLGTRSGQRVLHIGVGTGAEHALLQQAVGLNGLVVGYDLSRVMLNITRTKTATAFCEGDARQLPFDSQSFDQLFSAYLLDLIPASELPMVLSEFQRVLRPGGRMVLVSLTEGIDLPSRLFVAGWKRVYRRDPQRLGGCRPLQLAKLLEQTGLEYERHVVVQRSFPSEIIVVQG